MTFPKVTRIAETEKSATTTVTSHDILLTVFSVPDNTPRLEGLEALQLL